MGLATFSSVALLFAPSHAYNFAARVASTPATSKVSRANVVARNGFLGAGRVGELGGIEATSYGDNGGYGGYGMGGMYGGYGGMGGMYGGMGRGMYGGYGGYGMNS